MSKKSRLARLLYATGVLSLMLWINRLFARRLIIVAYHRILDVDLQNETDFPSDIELVSASVADFEWQIGFLSRCFSVMTFKDYAKASSEDKSPANVAIITFDDGFYDNYENAFPILRSQGVPAVFFVSTSYLGSNIPFWFENLVSIINQAPQEHLEGLRRIISMKSVPVSRKEFAESALESLKRVSDEARLDTMKAISSYCKEHKISVESSRSLAMNWNNAREMVENGMEIGSHTVTHPILTNLSSDSLRYEIEESKNDIETELGISCSSFSYPNGGAQDINQLVVDVVRESGYEYACSYIPGVNNHNDLSSFVLKRLHIERYVSRADFAAMLAMPWFFGQ